MRKRIIKLILTAILLISLQTPGTSAAFKLPNQDSRELQFQDILLQFLLPYIHDKLAEVYSTELTVTPDVYPYFIDVTHVERVNGFRGYQLQITLDIIPTVGPHISVGEDLITFEISPIVGVKLMKAVHLKGPDKKDFPPNYLDLLK
jgi:hypothetical protein